jgi:hypothetical protein
LIAQFGGGGGEINLASLWGLHTDTGVRNSTDALPLSLFGATRPLNYHQSARFIAFNVVCKYLGKKAAGLTCFMAHLERVKTALFNANLCPRFRSLSLATKLRPSSTSSNCFATFFTPFSRKGLHLKVSYTIYLHHHYACLYFLFADQVVFTRKWSHFLGDMRE